MPQSYLIFDFDGNEDAAQRARHRIEGWKQAFRLGAKMQLKFERRVAEKAAGGEAGANAAETIRLLVRLDFSDHEKLSHQRWLDRLPAEEPFKDAQQQIVRAGDPAFDSTAELFDGLP